MSKDQMQKSKINNEEDFWGGGKYNIRKIFGTSEKIRFLCFVEDGHVRKSTKKLTKYELVIIGEMCVCNH